MRIAFPFALVVAATAAPARASVIFNSVGVVNPPGIHIINEPDETSSLVEIPGAPGTRETDARVGDAITFAGTDRFVTAFTIRMWSFTTPVSTITADAELTIYTNAAGLPGTVLWSGTVPGVTLAATSPVPVVFVPSLTLPNSVCFAIALSNISGTRMFGLGSAQSASVGTSPNSTLRQDSATLAWRIDNSGPGPFGQVEARVEAVPSPGGLAALALGLGLLARRRR